MGQVHDAAVRPQHIVRRLDDDAPLRLVVPQLLRGAFRPAPFIVTPSHLVGYHRPYINKRMNTHGPFSLPSRGNRKVPNRVITRYQYERREAPGASLPWPDPAIPGHYRQFAAWVWAAAETSVTMERE